MNNPIIGFIFGIAVTVITALCVLGEVNIWAFAGINGLLLTGVKEVVNVFMVDNKPNKVNIIATIIGVVLTAIVLLFIL